MAAMTRPHDALGRAAACLTALAWLTLLASQPEGGCLVGLDQGLTSLVARRRSEHAITVAHAVSAAAEPRVVLVPLAIATTMAARRQGWRAAFEPGLTVIAGMALRRALSRLIARQRPPEAMWLIEPAGFSLPSRHTSLAALTAGACATALGADRLVSDTAVAVTTVGASRICLGVHWPTDVLAGWLFAAGWLDLVRSLVPRADRRTS